MEVQLFGPRWKPLLQTQIIQKEKKNCTYKIMPILACAINRAKKGSATRGNS